MSSPQDFARIERDRTWDVSPYVSQERVEALWKSLFVGYFREVPPVPEDAGPLPVGIGINFVKFKGFDEVTGTMDIALNLRLCWDDPRLSFDAHQFFNRSWSLEGERLPIMSDLIWTPDVTVLNVVGGIHSLIEASPLVLSDDSFRKETGVNLLWSRPLDVRTNCNADMTEYPFDEQVCFVRVGSLTFSEEQLFLVPQPFFAEYTVHTSEFRVHNITVSKMDTYKHSTSQMYSQVVYRVMLQRYPHFYVLNFILPMVALTALTVATMWMSPGNAGPRVNSGAKMLLCVVSIIFITARHRPALHGDIWLDRFQSHCLALSFTSVLESIFVDYLARVSPTGVFELIPELRVDSLDSILRSLVCWVTVTVIIGDACQVKRYHALTLYTSFSSASSALLVAFVYLVFAGLIVSSTCSVAWLGLPRKWQRKLLGGKVEDATNGELALPIAARDASEPTTRKSERRMEATTPGISASGCSTVVPSAGGATAKPAPSEDGEEDGTLRILRSPQRMLSPGPLAEAARWAEGKRQTIVRSRSKGRMSNGEASPVYEGWSRCSSHDDMQSGTPARGARRGEGADVEQEDVRRDAGKRVVVPSADTKHSNGCEQVNYEFLVDVAWRMLACSLRAKIARVVDGVTLLAPQSVERLHAPRFTVSEVSSLPLPEGSWAAGPCVQAWPEGVEFGDGGVCFLIPAHLGATNVLRSTSVAGLGGWEELQTATFLQGYAIVCISHFGSIVPVASAPAVPSPLGPASVLLQDSIGHYKLELHLTCDAAAFRAHSLKSTCLSLAHFLPACLHHPDLEFRTTEKHNEAWVEVCMKTPMLSIWEEQEELLSLLQEAVVAEQQQAAAAAEEESQAAGSCGPPVVLRILQAVVTEAPAGAAEPS